MSGHHDRTPDRRTAVPNLAATMVGIMDTAEMATADNHTLNIFLTLAWFREGGLDENTSPRDASVCPALAYISSIHDASPNAEVTYILWCPEIISNGIVTWQRSLWLQGHQSRWEEAVSVPAANFS